MKKSISLFLSILSVMVCRGQDLNLVKYEDTQNIKAAERISNGTDTRE